MVDLLERIGPYLGIAAFLGLAILAFLIFQQAREVRRLREWAGRAPERAGEAAEATAAAAEARGEATEAESEEEEELPRGRVGAAVHAVRGRASRTMAELDRRMPVDPRYAIAVLAALLIAAAVLTSGFGLFGDDGSGGGGGKRKGGQANQEKPEKVEVAVLNATQIEDGDVPIDAVQGLAGRVADEVVKPAGFKPGAEETAASGFDETTIMFEPGAEEDAQELSEKVADQLGETPTTPIIGEVRDLAAGAQVALVVGADDAQF